MRVLTRFVNIPASVVVALALCLLAAGSSDAAEGGASNYFPGSFGQFAPGMTPPPGLTLTSTTNGYKADVDQTALQGRVNINLNSVAFIETLTGLYAFDTKILGATPAIGASLPFGYASIDTAITGPSPLSALGKIEEDTWAVGDFSLIPVSLFWEIEQLGVHVNLYELVVMPSGQYDTGNLINLGRNYWSFDTVLATTWLYETTGTEISVVQGILGNTENELTNYRTGLEYHFDAMLNQFLAEEFAIGLHFYTYQQMTRDSGTPNNLGGYKGESIGIGPQLLWRPSFLGGKVTLMATWLRDLSATNRLEADYGTLVIAYTP